MCGRFYVDDDMVDEMERIFEKIDLERADAKRGEVYPSEKALIIRQKDDTGILIGQTAAFGYKNPYKKSALFINAKSETITEKPTFSRDFAGSRCVIPASGYFEWKGKEKYYFRNETPLLLLAGICRQQEFVILTTAAAQNVYEIHDRMPLILTPQEARQWIGNLQQAQMLLYKPSEIESWKKIS